MYKNSDKVVILREGVKKGETWLASLKDGKGEVVMKLKDVGEKTGKAEEEHGMKDMAENNAKGAEKVKHAVAPQAKKAESETEQNLLDKKAKVEDADAEEEGAPLYVRHSI